MKITTALAALSASVFFDIAAGRSLHLSRAVDPATTDPNDDPFYAVPSNITKYLAGDVIDKRLVVTSFNNPVGQPYESYQIKYRTNDGQDKATATVATLWIPSFPDNNPAKIFSYQVPEDAINLDCAPSWAWLKGSQSNNGNVTNAEGLFFIPWALHRGYYVIQPDAEGPKATWLVGKMEGQATLDANRAAINFLGLDIGTTKIAMYGYSGGAHTTVWAASLAETYAPKLNIVGAAYGGTPIDLIATFETLNNKSQAILAGAALFGLALGYPNLQTNYQTGANGLTTQGKAIQKLFVSRRYCPSADPGDYNGTDWNTYFKGPLLQNQVLLDVAYRESLLNNVSTIKVPVPKFPRLEYHGTSDTTVPFPPEQAYVQQQCDQGANILFYPFSGLDHLGAELKGQSYAKAFIVQAFNGNTPYCPCGSACYKFPESNPSSD